METLKLIPFIEAAAVVVSALSGMIRAAEKKLDVVGAYSLALLVAFGGGTLRDVLLNRRPFFWVENEKYLLIVLAITIAFVYLPFAHRLARFLHKRSNTVDAVGLGLFSISGLFTALNSGLPLFSASLMGVITGVAGGVFRDMVTNDIPVIFRHTGGLYAIASFAGCWICIGTLHLSASPFSALLAGSGSVVALRLISVYFGLEMPKPLYVLPGKKKK